MPNQSNTASLAELQKAATLALRRSFSASDAERTERLRDTARAFISAREHFFTKEGDPDWAGRTFAYRTWVREVMSAANVPQETLSATQAAIRYHAGNILREVLDDDDLDKLGLRKASPRERSVEKRERTTLALALVSGGTAIEGAENIIAAAHAIDGILKRIDVSNVARAEWPAVEAALRVTGSLAWNLSQTPHN